MEFRDAFDGCMDASTDERKGHFISDTVGVAASSRVTYVSRHEYIGSFASAIRALG